MYQYVYSWYRAHLYKCAVGCGAVGPCWPLGMPHADVPAESQRPATALQPDNDEFMDLTRAAIVEGRKAYQAAQQAQQGGSGGSGEEGGKGVSGGSGEEGGGKPAAA